MKKNILYIDAANLIKSSQKWIKVDYDIYELLVYLKDRYRINQCIYFTGKIKSLEVDYEKLKKLGVEIVFKEIYREENKTKANCDVEISHRITYDLENNLVNKIVLVSGDGDFASLLDYAKSRINEVKVFSVIKYNTSRLLRSRRYLNVTYLNDLIYSIKGKGPTGHVVQAGPLFGNINISNLENKSRKIFKFKIEKKSEEAKLMRTGKIITPHGEILTPAFIPVGTKATVKSLQVKDILEVGSQAVLANTYHLYLQPGQEIVKQAGGFGNFMGWKIPHLTSPNLGEESNRVLPTFTDSGGFQVLSLGAAFNSGVTKIATDKTIAEAKQKEILFKNEKGEEKKKIKSSNEQMAKVDEEGVTFKSFIDGSMHRFTPEISMQIQHDLGADIFFAFDECTSPLATREYQISAMERTHRWAERCLQEHKKLGVSSATGQQQALFAVVQGGAYKDLRKISAETLGKMDFDGFGIGGSFTKKDMDETVQSATEFLPENKPRHLLGIGEPIDFFIGVEYGCDTFDCVSPTRMGRHGNIYTEDGKINLRNGKYKNDFRQISDDPNHPSFGYSFAYLAHLFRADEMLASTIASKHNLYFLIKLVEKIRVSILNDNFFEFKKEFCDRFYKSEY